MRNIIIKFILAFMIFLGSYSCSEDILDQYPQSQISLGSYFSQPSHFADYVNQFYPGLASPGWFSAYIYAEDYGTDNQIGNQPALHLNGETIKEATDDEWTNGYIKIRALNIMLNIGFKNLPKGQEAEASRYLGEAYFFRAFTYFTLLKKFGGVPIIKEEIAADDEAALKSPRASRYELMAFILSDLNEAAKMCPSGNTMSNQGRITKEVVLAFKSRMCLYEGTWEKYHGIKNTPFAVAGQDGKEFLREAADAAKEVIESKIFSLYTETDEPYFNLFNRNDLSGNPEVIYYRLFDPVIQGRTNLSITSAVFGGTSEPGKFGMTNDLVNAYLDIEGNPASNSNLSLTDTSLTLLFNNRDPRLKQTMYYPNVLVNTGSTDNLFYPVVPRLRNIPTGYHSRKGASQDAADFVARADDQDVIIIRYGEVLLNYIEALAELDEVTQNDINITVNALRERGGLTSNAFLDIGNVPVDSDDEFIKAGMKPLLAEIRRERRIELAVEGFRVDDIRRWAAADVLLAGKTYYGALYDVWVRNAPKEYKAGGYIINSNGYLDPWGGKQIGFNLNRDYLYPIPTEEITLAGYEQNPGW